MYNNPGIWQEIKYKYHYGGTHVKIIFINVAIFVILTLVLLIDNLLFKGIGEGFILKQILGSSDLQTILHKPWIILTNIFVHLGLLHLFFNMLFLNLFGGIVKDLVGNSKIIPIFLMSGIMGFITFVLAYNLIPAFKSPGGATICGASGGVMGITFAAVALSPNYEIRLLFLGNVKIKWLAIFYVFMDIISLQGENAGGSIAHMGGALLGFVYIRQLQSGRDWARPFYIVEDWIANLKAPKRKVKVAYKKEEKVAAGSREFNSGKSNQSSKQSADQQERLDEILDKINKSGYDSLSTEEKAFLFKISQED